MYSYLCFSIALLTFAWSGPLSKPANAQDDVEKSPRLQYVTTVRQFGPVGYRDPLGSMSPDGVWLAYAVGPRLYVQRIVGGAVRELGPAMHRITDLAWLPDSRHLAVRERVFDRSKAHWFVYDLSTDERTLLWPDRPHLQGSAEGDPTGQNFEIKTGQLQQLAWSPDGNSVAGIVKIPGGTQVWTLNADGGAGRIRISNDRVTYPQWTPNSQDLACLVFAEGHQALDVNCMESGRRMLKEEAYGPFVFLPDDKNVYYGAPNELGTLDLWKSGRDSISARQLTHFTRDTYAPSIARDGRVLFKTQDYRLYIAVAPAEGGPTRQITNFQSETPSWNWSSTHIAFTFGTWRRTVDDFHYPDISQHIGIVRVDEESPAQAPETVVRSSYSEDQAMHWSPNGQWIAFHTHAEGTDDVWLQPADGSQPPHLISEGGHETGWPRWSPDGRWIVYPSFVHEGASRRGVLYLVGIDEATGTITMPQMEIPLEGLTGDAGHAEWSSDSEQLVFEGIENERKRMIYTVPREGGRPNKIHSYDSDQVYSGISVSPDFEWVAFIKRASDGYFQVFRVPVKGGKVEQVTFDPIDKTQPAYAPDGERIAFTVFNYKAHFWLLVP